MAESHVHTELLETSVVHLEWELSVEASGTWSRAARTLQADSDYEEVWRCALKVSVSINSALITACISACAHAWLHSTSTETQHSMSKGANTYFHLVHLVLLRQISCR